MYLVSINRASSKVLNIFRADLLIPTKKKNFSYTCDCKNDTKITKIFKIIKVIKDSNKYTQDYKEIRKCTEKNAI